MSEQVGVVGAPGLNMAWEAVDRQVAAGRGDCVALRLIGRGSGRREVRYLELAQLSDALASGLAQIGVGAGDVVVVLCGRVLDLYVTVLGALKRRCIVCPVFAAFGPEPVVTRLGLSQAKVLVTTSPIYSRTVGPHRRDLPDLEHVFTLGNTRDAAPGTRSLDDLLAAAPASYTIEHTHSDDPALLHFTSGTTGTPKGAVHVHGAVVSHRATTREVLDVGEEDVFWCTADPGWVTGTSYGIIGPLTCGATMVVDESEFDPSRWYRILAEEAVDVWYTAPTAIRMLMKAGSDVPGLELPRPNLRLACSVGEPLAPDAVEWGRQVIGLPFRDTWWQTETGGIMVANLPGAEIRPGSMGRPVPGVDVAIVACDDEGVPWRDGAGDVELVPGAAHGMLAIRAPWPSMFRAYLGAPERYGACFARSAGSNWYLSGDLVRRDEDGYLWFISRADDVIKTAGHLVGPFEVEQVLVEHEAVVEAGVYAVPDPIAGSVVHAAVVVDPSSVRPSTIESGELERSVMALARRRLGAAVAPRRIALVDDLPKTRSGKILRRVLRARELGLPEGDLSMLETGTPA